MSDRTVELAAHRIAEHVDAHDLPFVNVILHGGEPLLAGHGKVALVARTVRGAVRAATQVNLHVQTNGLLLDEAFLELFERLGIRVGVSLDGAEADNDRHRVYADKRGSHAEVARALELLATRHPDLYGGILCTIQLESAPLATYRELLRFGPPQIDFLLPHGNWTTPPPQRRPDDPETPYADWLIAIFDEWFEANPQPTRIRLFESILDLLLGGASLSEVVGLSPIDVLIVETDGTIEQGDALKTTASGMAATGLHVASASFDDALTRPGFRARQLGLAGLSKTCRDCPIVRVCGGGLYAHRYRVDNGFDNPSVYCPDLLKLVRHIDAEVMRRGAVHGIRTILATP